jgi:hypothetical protein
MKNLKMILAGLVLVTGYAAHADTEKEFIITKTATLKDVGITIPEDPDLSKYDADLYFKNPNTGETLEMSVKGALDTFNKWVGENVTVTLKEVIDEKGYIISQKLVLNAVIPANYLRPENLTDYPLNEMAAPYELVIDGTVCTTDSCGDHVVKGLPVSNPQFDTAIPTIKCPVNTGEACTIHVEYERAIPNR